jgi:hypothetical protein
MHHSYSFTSTAEPLIDDDDRIDIAETLAVAANELMTTCRFDALGADFHDDH